MLHYFPVIRPGVDIFKVSMFTTNICGCSQCWDPVECTSLRDVQGPHDLNCICPQCLRDFQRFSDEKVEDMFDHRFLGASIPYTTPPNSPTNKEMHAYNGNHGHQHARGNGDFLRAAARGLRRGATEPERFAAGTLGATALVGGGLTYSSFKDMGKPLNELREQIFGRVGPSDVDKTRNFKRLDFGKDPGIQIDVSKLTHPEKNPRLPKVKKPVPMAPGIKVPLPKPEGIEPKKHFWDEVQWHLDDPNNLPDELKPQDIPRMPDMPVNPPQKPNLIDSIPPPVGPSNGEMHAYNGNIYNGPARPYTRAVAARMAKKAAKRRAKKLIRRYKKAPNHPKVVNYKRTIRKGFIKGEKQAVKKNNQERKIALYYAKFLRQPTAGAPRLGSTGNLPTKIVHGYYEITINMAGVGIGGQPALSNATELLVFLSPKIFAFNNSNSASLFSGPVNIGASISPTAIFNNTAASSTFFTTDFANAASLKNEVGAALDTSDVPLARWLGGHVSLICRCPVATTAPPFMFGGLLPMNITQNTGASVNYGKQLNQLASSSIRILKSTDEIPSMEGSVVYAPATSKNLDMSPNLCTYQSGNNMDATPIPYIGMTGCPTSANVTIIVSCFYEVSQTASNMTYAGFGRGPKVSAEDVFDNLPRIKPVAHRALSLGNKDDANSSGAVMAQMLKLMQPKEITPEEKLDKVLQQYDQLKNTIKELKLQIPDDSDEEDEKYFDESSSYKNLSKSTIDLALSLKDKLTPGSVTSKTVRSSLP